MPSRSIRDAAVGMLIASPLILLRDVQALVPFWVLLDLRSQVLPAVAIALLAVVMTLGIGIGVTWVLEAVGWGEEVPARRAAFLAASLVAAIFVAWGRSNWISLSWDFDILWLLQTFAFSYAVLAVTDFVYRTFAGDRELANQLVLERERLSAVLAQSEVVLDDVTRQLTSFVEGVALPELRRLEEHVQSVRDNGSEAAGVVGLVDDLSNSAHQVFKPASQLAASPSATAASSFQLPAMAKVGFARQLVTLLDVSFTRTALNPRLLPIVAVSVYLLVAPLVTGQVLWSVGCGLAASGLLFAVGRLAPDALWQRGWPTRLVTCLCAYVGAGLLWVFLSLVAIRLVWGGLPLPIDATIWGVLVVVGWATVGSILALGQGLRGQFQTDAEELRAVVTDIRRQLDQLDEAIDQVRSTVAHVIHTDVQGRVVGSALVLKLALPTGDLAVATAECQQHLASTIDLLAEDFRRSTESGSADLAAGLNELIGAWRGLVDIAVTVDGEPLGGVINARPVYPQTVVRSALRVVGEAVSNSAIHGSAREVAVALDCRPDGLAIAIRDDGTGLAADASAGGGSLELGRTQADWRLEPNDGGLTRGCTLSVFLAGHAPSRAANSRDA